VDLTLITALVGVLVTAAAVGVALWQLRAGLAATRVQRVIDLHRDLTTGEVGAARDRFTTLMWKHGNAVARDRATCHAPMWDEVHPGTGEAGDAGGQLGHYDERVISAEHAEPMRDLYTVLWCFERVETGRAGGALDDEMLRDLIGHHAVWWARMLHRLTSDNTVHIGALRSLAAAVETAKSREWALRDFPDS
jgi:hypothetical protein